MQAHYFQHVPFEGIGMMEPWLLEHGYSINCTRFYAGDPLPDQDAIDILIVMGGPMSVNDEEQLPWLIDEMNFIRNTIQAGKPVLGVCLGAQLITKCMGGSIIPNMEREIGWFPCTSVSSGGDHFSFPENFEAFHWHGETFTLPDGAIHLARSEACKHQAFQLGPRVIGMQFHLETTPDCVAALIEHCADELIDAPFVQTIAEMQSVPEHRYRALNTTMASILEYLTR
ncbi:MAG: type 1 glutamine amidotransferase [Luteolibacter sp.]